MFFAFCMLFLALGQTLAEAAPQIAALQRLDLGVLAITSNIVPTSVTLSPQGTTAYGSGFVFVAAAKPGHYQLTGYPAFTDITVTMVPALLNLLSGVPGESLTASTASTSPKILHTDQNGAVAFDLGATLTTSGNNLPYQDGAYIGHATLTLNFDVGGQPQQNYQDIEVDVTLRSSLVLAEVQALNFGKLALRSSATDQASLTLATNGTIGLSNASGARIIRFGGEVPATIRVTTGAANASVSIQLPSATVYLVHQSQASNIARLLITNFVSLPATATPNARLNAQGALDIRIGATLRTEQTANPYRDGVYSGTYPVSVDYF
jgi:hypothetical protein